jgi:hypothetical protein
MGKGSVQSKLVRLPVALTDHVSSADFQTEVTAVEVLPSDHLIVGVAQLGCLSGRQPEVGIGEASA